MFEFLKNKVSGWLSSRSSRTVITENSSLEDLIKLYPSALTFLQKRYSITEPVNPSRETLKDLAKKYSLPPPQIIFMEIQLQGASDAVEEITALEAQHLVQRVRPLKVIDVRESWERTFGSIPRSQILNDSLFSEALRSWPKDSEILFYCHFGVRSRDAAHEFFKNGFTKLYVIRGGIDAWSSQVDPTIPRYSGAYC